jgi:hypothetical protein
MVMYHVFKLAVLQSYVVVQLVSLKKQNFRKMLKDVVIRLR